MTSTFKLAKDAAGQVIYGLPIYSTKYSTTLVADTAQSLTLPSDTDYYDVFFRFTVGAEVWVAYNNVATLPGSAFALSNSEPNPSVRKIPGGTTISVICGNDDVTVHIAFFKSV